MTVRIQTESFDPAAEIAALRATARDIGAVVSFLGLVRDMNDGQDVRTLTLEHYPGMTERSIAALIDEARVRWPIGAARVVHRVGTLLPAEPIVLVAVSAAHRAAAFAACAYLIDQLKTRAPFWKREETPLGPRWLAPRPDDAAAAARWAPPVA